MFLQKAKILFCINFILCFGISKSILIEGQAYGQSITHIPSQARQNASQYERNFDLLIISFPIQGWYLMSLPLTVADSSVSTLFPVTLGAFTWDTNRYVRVTTIEPGKGYWLAIPAPSVAVIEGDPLNQFSGHFAPGCFHLQRARRS